VLASVRPLFVAAALASGAAIYAAEPAKRIAALAPSITELVYAAGAGKSLVAVSAFSDYPEAARQLPQVADFAGINLEALIRLKPDLVLVWESGTRQADIARLRSLQIRTESIRIDTFDDVPKAIRRIGEFAGTTETAYAAAEKFVLRAKELADKNRGKPKVSVFFEIGRSPLLTIMNVFASASQQVFQPSHETLLQIDPQVVMRGASPHGNRDRDDGLYQGFAAYRRGQILSVNADHILRPGPRLIDAAADVCDVLDGVRAAK